MKAAFCGTIEGMTKWQEKELAKTITRLSITEILLRDYRGSDKLAINVALDCGVKNFSIYPINNSKNRAFYFPAPRELYEWVEYQTDTHGPIHYRMEPIKAPLLAAGEMIKDCSLLIATPKEFSFTLHSGTWYVIKRAWAAKKDTIIIPPINRDGD